MVENLPIECGMWKGEGSFIIYKMDNINVVLGLTFLEAYNRVFKRKKWELVMQSDGKEFVLRPSHNLSGNGQAATSRDTDVTNRDLDASRKATRG